MIKTAKHLIPLLMYWFSVSLLFSSSKVLTAIKWRLCSVQHCYSQGKKLIRSDKFTAVAQWRAIVDLTLCLRLVWFSSLQNTVNVYTSSRKRNDSI